MNKKLESFLTIGIMGLVFTFTIIAFVDKVNESRLKVNNCLEEEKNYYRIEGGFIFSSKVITTKDNSDNYDYKCIKWEEEPSFGKIILGQELIHNKGKLNSQNRVKEKKQ